MNKAMLFLPLLFILFSTSDPLIVGKEDKGDFTGLMALNPVSWRSVAWASSDPTQNEIRWFKDEMKISPKYIERKEGVLGLSWAHFFTMIIVFAFGVGTLIVFIIRYRRTKQLIRIIKEEKAYGSQN